MIGAGATGADEAGRAAHQCFARHRRGYRRTGGRATIQASGGRWPWTFFRDEPKTADEEFVSPLRGMDNVLLTPHVGGSTAEAQQNIGTEVAEKLIKYSNNGSTLSAVNFPEVSLPEHSGKHRLLHIHRNQPGVLSAINAVFSEQQINIAGQYLQTNAKIGYVVIDVETHEPGESLKIKRRLESVPGTIRTRILY